MTRRPRQDHAEFVGLRQPPIGRPRKKGPTFKQIAAGLAVLFVALTLGSCGAVSGLVSDNWPHWAGGEPRDVPPRPGAPGYEEFIAHKPPPSQTANEAAPPGGVPATGNPQAIQPGNPPAGSSAATAGGLY